MRPCKDLRIIFVVNLSHTRGLDRPNENVVALEYRYKIPRARQMFMSSWLEPTDRAFITSDLWQVIELVYPSMDVKPLSHFPQRLLLIIWQSIGIDEIGCSAK